MSKGNSGHFSGTLGTSYMNSSIKEQSYTDRGITLPQHIQAALSKLKKPGDFIVFDNNDITMTDVSIMSRETGVEFAKVSLATKAYLIRGNAKGTVIPDSLLDRINAENGVLEFHSHPHNDDLFPSFDDRKVMKELRKATGQQYSTIVKPNGRTAIFNENGIIETGTIPNTIDETLKKLYYEMFGGE